MVGMSLVPVGDIQSGGAWGGDTVGEVSELGLGLFTLAVMIGVTVWGRGIFHLL